MSQIPEAAKAELAAALRRADDAARTGGFETRWRNLEDAHILSQPAALTHVRVHLKMLRAGWDQRDRTEVLGQLTRIVVAGPGSWTGRYPVGNTGRARVPATRQMPIRPDLAKLLD